MVAIRLSVLFVCFSTWAAVSAWVQPCLQGPLARPAATQQVRAVHSDDAGAVEGRESSIISSTTRLDAIKTQAFAFLLPGLLQASAPSGASSATGKDTVQEAAARKITHTAFIDIRIVGFRPGEEKATQEDYSGRMTFGLYGNSAPYAVQQFMSYVNTTYGSASPSYWYSSFTKLVPGVFVVGGRIKDVKQIEIAGSTEYEFEDRLIPVLGVDEPSGAVLQHDRRGLLTKDNLQDSRDPTFCITVGKAPKLDGLYTPFGELLEGDEVLREIEKVPIYTFSSTEPDGSLADNVFRAQKEAFLNFASQLGDERAVDRRGAFLKRVETTQTGLLAI